MWRFRLAWVSSSIFASSCGSGSAVALKSKPKNNHKASYRDRIFVWRWWSSVPKQASKLEELRPRDNKHVLSQAPPKTSYEWVCGMVYPYSLCANVTVPSTYYGNHSPLLARRHMDETSVETQLPRVKIKHNQRHCAKCQHKLHQNRPLSLMESARMTTSTCQPNIPQNQRAV